MKYPIKETPKPVLKYRNLEWDLYVKVTAALRDGEFDEVERLMKKYNQSNVQRFIEGNIESFFPTAMLARNIESINFIIKHVKKDLLMKTIEKDERKRLSRFINVIFPMTEEQNVREIRREILIKLAELDDELGKFIYSVGHEIFNN